MEICSIYFIFLFFAGGEFTETGRGFPFPHIKRKMIRFAKNGTKVGIRVSFSSEIDQVKGPEARTGASFSYHQERKMSN